jgi:hypothetical protein
MQIFKDEPIVIKGVFNFSLKNVAKKLYEYGFIDCIWDTETQNGEGVLINAVKALEEKCGINNIALRDTPMMQDIIKYNSFDCKTLYEIIQFLIKM